MKNRSVAIPASILVLSALTLVISGCGRQTKQSDPQRAALQQAAKNQEQIAAQIKARQEQMATQAKQQAEKQQKARQEVTDERFRHGKLVIAGPMIKEDSRKSTDPVSSQYKGIFFLDLNHGRVGNRDVNDAENIAHSRRHFSRALTDWGRQQLSRLRQQQSRSVVHIGCNELTHVEQALPQESEPEINDIDLTRESDPVRREERPAPQTMPESPLLSRINSGLSEKIMVDEPIENADGRQLVEADTVIACSTYNAQTQIVARRLILVDFAVNLVGRNSAFFVFVEDLYLLGENRIFSNSSGSKLDLEVSRDFSQRPPPFDTGKLNIIVQGPSVEK